jgi:cytochrome c oxidase subunit 2
LALVAVGCARTGNGTLPQNALDPAGPIARIQDHLWNIVFPIAVVVFVLVQGLILVAVVRFRDHGEDQPPKQVAGNTRLEVLWTMIPALILVGIAIPTIGTIFRLSGPEAADALTVRVIGKQYWWQFEYLNAGAGPPVRTANELHIPTGREVFIQLEGRPDEIRPEAEKTGDVIDVIHSFWVPRLAGKQDYVPGHERTMKIQADEPGRYPGQCAEFCGLSHADMRFVVIADTPADFDAWIAAQRQPAVTPSSELVRQGEQLFAQQQCFSCHTLQGNPMNADARVGPSLTHFAERAKFAGYTYERTDENLRQWISNPQSLKLGAQMPPYGLGPALNDQQLSALVAYLQSLK